MPGFLKFLTGLALASVIFLPATLLPGGVDLGGGLVSRREWWGSGSGFIFAATVLLMISSGVLMLRRTRYSRAAHLAAWLALYCCVPVLRRMNDMAIYPHEMYAYVGIVIASIAILAIYLYIARGSRNYFGSV
jgi:hypothetical protein